MIREAINAELARRSWTKYQLWRAVHETVPKSVVYEFLGGKRDIWTKYVDQLLAALDLEITPKKQVKRKPPPSTQS